MKLFTLTELACALGVVTRFSSLAWLDTLTYNVMHEVPAEWIQYSVTHYVEHAIWISPMSLWHASERYGGEHWDRFKREKGILQ